MDIKAKINNLFTDYTGKMVLSIEVDKSHQADVMQMVDELNGKDLRCIFKRWREKRSRDANAYFWTLCDKLALKTGQSKIDIYRSLIRDIGGNSIILPIKDIAVDHFIENWGKNDDGKKHIGWICDTIGKSKFPGYTNVMAYYGSSTYNTEQMSKLIDSVVYECHIQGIQTETPNEIANMLSLWESGSKGA